MAQLMRTSDMVRAAVVEHRNNHYGENARDAFLIDFITLKEHQQPFSDKVWRDVDNHYKTAKYKGYEATFGSTNVMLFCMCACIRIQLQRGDDYIAFQGHEGEDTGCWLNNIFSTVEDAAAMITEVLELWDIRKFELNKNISVFKKYS